MQPNQGPTHGPRKFLTHLKDIFFFAFLPFALCYVLEFLFYKRYYFCFYVKEKLLVMNF